MNIKKNDTVTVITGKDKGTTGKVLRAIPKEYKIIVEGVNIKKRHTKPQKGGQKGQIIETPHPISVSNVKVKKA
jgi:large subunit ribosomal protein L24